MAAYYSHSHNHSRSCPHGSSCCASFPQPFIVMFMRMRRLRVVRLLQVFHKKEKTVLRFLAIFVLLAALSAHGGGRIEKRLAAAGYVDVQQAVPGLMVELMYARPDNFTGVVLYDSTERAFLHHDAARALSRAGRLLAKEAPGLRLLVKDAARPVSVQRKMFNAVRGTPKARYVANPARGGGVHNFGLAVDITLCDSLGNELSMGTPVDHLGYESNITAEQTLLKRGIITAQELTLRRLLRSVMTRAGFKTIRSEWWHFELVRRADARQRYKLIDF